MNSNDKKIKKKKRIKKKRIKTSRKFRFFLLSLGIAGIAIGVIMSFAALMYGKSRMLFAGIIYIVIFAAILFIRKAIIEYDNIRKRRYAAGR